MILRLGVCFLALTALSDGSDKEFKVPTPAYPDNKSFPSGCEAVWSAAMPVLEEVGLAAQSMDRQGGFAYLKWTKGDYVGFGSRGDVRRYTINYSKSWTNYDLFRIETGTLFVIPETGGCKGQLKIVFKGLKRDPFAGDRWYPLESNNFLEQSLLDRIGERIGSQRTKLQETSRVQEKQQIPVPPQPPVQTTPVPATVAVTSNPSGGTIAVDGKFLGNTPSKFELTAGKHEVLVRKPGHRDWRRSLNLPAGRSIALAADLVAEEPERPAALAVASAPQPTQPGAELEKPAVLPTADEAAGVAPAKEVDSLRIVCSDRFSAVPFSSSRPDRKTLACGEPVTIIKQTGLWIRVKTKDGLEGNVAARFVGK